MNNKWFSFCKINRKKKNDSMKEYSLLASQWTSLSIFLGFFADLLAYVKEHKWRMTK